MPKASQRRAKGDGGLYQRASDGMWIGSVDVGWTPGGARKRRTVSAKRYADARAKLRDLRKSIDTHGDAPTAMTVERWLTYWLENIARPRNRPRTVTAYRSVVNRHLIPHLGKRRLDQLQQRHVRDMLRALEKPTSDRPALAPAMVIRVQRVLGKAIEDAMRDGLVPRNVVKLVETPTRTAGRDRGAYTVDQARQLLRAIAADDEYAARWAAALLLGRRPGELLGLEINRVDLDRAEAAITWQLQTVPFRHGCGTPRVEGRSTTWPCGHRFAGDCGRRELDVPAGMPVRQLEGSYCLTPPKSKAGERVVPLPPLLVALLELQIARQAARLNPHGLVWTRPDGRPINPKDDRAAWVALVASAGLPPLDLYAARHTFVTLMLAAGQDVKVIGELIGHTNPRTTRGYQHVTSEVARRAMTEHAELLGGD